MTTPTPLTFNQQGEGWHLNPRRQRWLRLGVGFIGVLGLASGVSNLAEGETAPGAGLLLFGGAMLTTAVMMMRRRTPLLPHHLATTPGPGLLLPVRGGSLGAIVGFAVLGVLFLVPVTGAGVVSMREGDWQGIVGIAIGLALGALFLVGSWGSLVARRTPDRGILLTPDAVVLRTRKQPETIPWAELVRVRDHWGRAIRVGPTMPDDVVRNWLTFQTREPDGDPMTLFSGSQSPSVPVEVLGTDPALALEICRHYLDHPVDRAGLASPSAPQRWL
ncbi:MAG: hypothetical protein ACXWDL_01335 [Nocardioides sp.]